MKERRQYFRIKNQNKIIQAFTASVPLTIIDISPISASVVSSHPIFNEGFIKIIINYSAYTLHYQVVKYLSDRIIIEFTEMEDVENIWMFLKNLKGYEN
ncbi:MAG: hypothetical protein CMF38_00290 [Legionellaceae bacterium]|nr:hypothetical protein [Legionellaceae bacterium]HAF87641.1 hypothetical protein [Legionellales bacterium]HCA89630.1 hypothetical protein [Legionellales bacterium]|tara:strand:+ start:492 stop:788 length:297 start_codon:yes stop_codon:yes gene_type:complete